MGKRCYTCKQYLPLENFSKDKRNVDGLMGRCKACTKKYIFNYCEIHKEELAKYFAEYYQNHKKEKAIYDAKYRKENKEIRDKQKAKYRKKHKKEINKKYRKRYKQDREKELARGRIYRKNNQEKEVTRAIKYQRNNKEIVNALTAKHRAIKLNQTPASADLKIIQLYYAVCSETNEILGNTFFHVDHIQPLSKDGLHHENNLQILESHLNLQKNDKWPLSSDERLKYSGITL